MELVMTEECAAKYAGRETRTNIKEYTVIEIT